METNLLRRLRSALLLDVKDNIDVREYRLAMTFAAVKLRVKDC